MAKRRNLNKQDVLAMYEYEPNISDVTVAEVFEVPLHVVRNIRYESGMKRKRGAKKILAPPARDTQILEMMRSGKTYQEVADQFVMTRQRVQQIAAKWGMERRGKHTPLKDRLDKLEPYMAFAIEPRRCWVCKAPLPVHHTRRTCTPCGSMFELLRSLRGALREIARTEDQSTLRRRVSFAYWLIRKYGLLPEDLLL